MRHPFLAVLVLAASAHAQTFTPALQAKVTSAVEQVVGKTGVPSASVGIVYGGKIVYTEAFGDARLQPELKATAAMSYPIGSVSKQFTATCILLLAEDGKLKLDDPVSRWFPELTRANEVTLRELLSHTSGYEDYAPQDYTIPAWTKPTDPTRLVREWAGKPLDFDPGTEWQYSNTNFVLAALIIEKASGMPYFDFLEQRVLKPVGIAGSALNLDTERDRVEPQGYERRALASLRPAILEAPGWYYGDASLAMPVASLLTWDLSIMNQTLLKPASYAAFETATKLKNGKPTRYSLGLSIGERDGHRVLEHSGEVGGFVSENIVIPDTGFAIAVLTNQEASSAASLIAQAVIPILLPHAAKAPAVAAAPSLKTILTGLQNGRIDRTLFTADANFYFSQETLDDFASSLKPFGPISAVTQQSETLRGGMSFHDYDVSFASGKSVRMNTYTMPDGKIEQLLVEAAN
jgi:CubicO group peptidase (beta-lactamase class C family)